MTVITVIAAIAGIWIAVSILLALFIGRTIRLADSRQRAQSAYRSAGGAPRVARAR